MKRRLFSTLWCSVLLVAGVLSGCGSREAHSDIVAPNEEAEAISTEAVYEADTVITITGWLEEPYTQNLMAYLAENYPEYSFKYKFIGKKSYESIIDVELASNEASDIVMVNPIMAKKHGKNGYIIDLSDFCSDYAQEAWDAFSYDGKMYAVPSTSEYQCTFFNREIFEKFGRKLPSEYEDFLKFSDDMKEELGIKPLSSA